MITQANKTINLQEIWQAQQERIKTNGQFFENDLKNSPLGVN